jgi:hypothetical protein
LSLAPVHAAPQHGGIHGRPHRRLLADIPAQVIIKKGRQTAKRELSLRFTEAIDMCAMRSGARRHRRLSRRMAQGRTDRRFRRP